MIRFKHRGDFKLTTKFLNAVSNGKYLKGLLEKYGEIGVEALRSATPVDTGKTANSWFYEIDYNGDRISITWNNSNINNYINIAVILQYGHGTGTGGYVEGRDYINPAIRPIFDEIADRAWKEVKNS